MTPPPLSRWAGLAAVATLWSSLGVAAVRSRFPVLGPRPLSWMAADPASAVLFGGGLILGAGLLVVFWTHVRARYRVDGWFSAALLGGLAGQVVAALVPIQGSPVAHRVHTVAALSLGASLPLLMWRFAATQVPGPWRRAAYGLFWLEAAACAVGIVLSRRSVAPLAEIVPALCFHLWIAVLTLPHLASAHLRVPEMREAGIHEGRAPLTQPGGADAARPRLGPPAGAILTREPRRP